MIVNCFQTFRVSYTVQATVWKGAYNLTFNLLTKLPLKIQLYNFFATVDKNISFCFNCGFLHFLSNVFLLQIDNMSACSETVVLFVMLRPFT